jgi:putative zinc finger protein
VSVTTPCLENISSETLSSWADGGLPEAEAARLRAHAEGCSACQERMRSYSDIRQLISGQRIPPAPPVDVAAVRAGQRRRNAIVQAGQRRTARRALWGGLGAAVAAALLIAAFSQVFAHLNHISPTTTVTPARTATPATARLTWAERTIPPGITLAQNGVGFAMSPATSQNGWVCSLGSDSKITIWGTTDQARSWRVMDHLTPLATPSPISSCYLVPDQVSPNILAMGLTWGAGAAGTLRMASYVSNDDGQTWSKLPGEVATPALATIGQRTYVIMSSLQSPHTRLMVSDDGFHTWRDVSPFGAYTPFEYLWPDPATGDLLLGAGPIPDANVLWRTNDGGAAWTQIALTNNVQLEYGSWLPAAHHWRICGVIQNTSDGQTLCTDDLGKTWSAYDAMTGLVTCVDCAKDKGGAPIITQDTCYSQPVIALDGSLLALCQPAGTVTQEQALKVNVYRLAPGAAAWQSLGPSPASGTAHVIGGLSVTGDPSSSAGALWYTDPVANFLAVAPLPS